MVRNTLEPLKAPASVDAQIDFVLGHPDMSDWIKQTLREALGCSPIEVLNDLEILNQILRARSERLIAEADFQAEQSREA